MSVNIVTGREMTRHDRRPTWRAHPAGHGEPMEVRALFRQTIDVGRLQIGMAVSTEVSPTPVICEDEDNVWFLGGIGSEGEGKKATNEELFHFEFLGHEGVSNNKQTGSRSNPELACQLKPWQDNLSYLTPLTSNAQLT